jgi:hypothetical protein
MSAAEPRTSREALIAVMLGEIDGLLSRVEALPGKVTEAEARLLATVVALDMAGDKYRDMITAFTEKAKSETAGYLEQKTSEITAKTMEEQRGAMQEAARLAFRSEASDKASSLGIALGEAAKEFRRSAGSRLLEHAITAMAASLFTAGLVYWIIK